LVDDRFLGVEVVVEAAREDARLLGDLPDGGGLEALAREELRGELDEVFAAFGSRSLGCGALRLGGAAGALSRCHGHHYAPAANQWPAPRGLVVPGYGMTFGNAPSK